MRELLYERLTGWGARLGFGAVLLVFSEWGVWQTPTDFSAAEWIGIGAVYLALAAVALDLIARFSIRDVLSVFLLAGLYGLVDATLISHITAHDLPLSLIIRPLAAQPLAFMGALGAFWILASGRATGPLDLLVAGGVGLMWGVWVRWFPVVSDQPLPAVAASTALAALGIGLLVCMLLRFAVPPADLYQRDDWLLLPVEWLVVGGTLIIALVAGTSRDLIEPEAVLLLAMMGGFLVSVLFVSGAIRPGDSLLARITPPRRPNPAAWLIVVVAALVAGWIGYHLPGSGEGSLQSDVLFGALTGFGLVWPPVVSTIIGVRAFTLLSRRGK